MIALIKHPKGEAHICEAAQGNATEIIVSRHLWNMRENLQFFEVFGLKMRNSVVKLSISVLLAPLFPGGCQKVYLRLVEAPEMVAECPEWQPAPHRTPGAWLLSKTI